MITAMKQKITEFYQAYRRTLELLCKMKVAWQGNCMMVLDVQSCLKKLKLLQFPNYFLINFNHLLN